jgi:hypothetical protein
MVQRDQLDQLDHCGVKLVAVELGRDAAFALCRVWQSGGVSAGRRLA